MSSMANGTSFVHPEPTPEEQAAADLAEWLAWIATPRGRLEQVRQQIATLRAEEIDLERRLGEDAIDFGAAPIVIGHESGVDLLAEAARIHDDPPPF
jgi:hypothetical protein